MKILVACEFSGIVSGAFRKYGHESWSCDLIDTEGDNQWHYKGDVRDILNNSWDMMLAFPPCDHLAGSGARWFKDKKDQQTEALDFVKLLLDAPIEYIALENPVGVISTHIRKPDQIIQPHQFGHPVFKRTCLWLKNLPMLKPTNQLVVPAKNTEEWKQWNSIHLMPDRKSRAKDRGRTFVGIGEAMAQQWGSISV